MDNTTLIEFKTIGEKAATDLRSKAVGTASFLEVSGFLVVFDRMGMQLCSCAVGPKAKPLFVQIAIAKAETVLLRQQSTYVWNQMILAKNIRVENYAGAAKTLFGGGLAIFADEECTDFVGVIAFSGGEEWQDRKICRVAIWNCGLYTDDKSKE